MYLLIDNDILTTLEEFILDNTAEDVQPLEQEHFDEIKALGIGDVYTIHGGASGDTMIKCLPNIHLQPEHETDGKVIVDQFIKENDLFNITDLYCFEGWVFYKCNNDDKFYIDIYMGSIQTDTIEEMYSLIKTEQGI